MGNPQTLASRLISRSALSKAVDTAPLIHSIRQGYETSKRDGVRHTFYIIFAPPTRPELKQSGKVNATKTSLHPIWYESLWLVLYTGASRRARTLVIIRNDHLSPNLRTLVNCVPNRLLGHNLAPICWRSRIQELTRRPWASTRVHTWQWRLHQRGEFFCTLLINDALSSTWPKRET